ncbi:uncharacterized protein B0I36DRAFT_329834 [Microdochium trichocladiopsis]|uniref:Uncharacterized protein n=1 Tax=Microdochium trichocladiopsis TaxID=1682393 RepID=A0A9P9BMA3_9PEZI|nr:uncharacterized protein B0I36DRAFT_329834 [Microdochium trichocladiopsis]KAH7026080.1 hypothetical protein B0I36DRAFT_329834 [Microdochium trichocladiopsis]
MGPLDLSQGAIAAGWGRWRCQGGPGPNKARCQGLGGPRLDCALCEGYSVTVGRALTLGCGGLVPVLYRGQTAVTPGRGLRVLLKSKCIDQRGHV